MATSCIHVRATEKREEACEFFEKKARQVTPFRFSAIYLSSSPLLLNIVHLRLQRPHDRRYPLSWERSECRGSASSSLKSTNRLYLNSDLFDRRARNINDYTAARALRSQSTSGCAPAQYNSHRFPHSSILVGLFTCSLLLFYFYHYYNFFPIYKLTDRPGKSARLQWPRVCL